MARGQDNGITILLGVKDLKIGEVTEYEEKIVVKASIKKREEICPYCGSAKLYKHGKGRTRQVLHTWSRGKRVYLELQHRRWKCKSCKHTFSEGRDLIRPHSRITKVAEVEVLWQLKDRSFAQVGRDLGISYSTLRRLLERLIDENMVGSILNEDEIHLGIDEHSFRHQDLVHTVTEVKQRKMLGVLKDDRIATLRGFLSNVPKDKVKEVCIDLKESLKKLAQEMFPQAQVVADAFHVIALANKKMDEARRIEQDIYQKRKVKIPKKIFLIGRDKLSKKNKQKVDNLLAQHPTLQGFYWAKERIRELYRQTDREEAAKLLDNIIFNLKLADDAELVRWGNTLKKWREPILNYFNRRTTNGYTEGCNTKIKMLKRISYGLRNVEVYWRKMLLGFIPSRECFHTI
jgi:transposase